MVQRYILTGTPGAGKTTILEQLAKLGYPTVDEAATALITDELARGRAEPWTGPSFVDDVAVLQRRRQQRSATSGSPVQFFDRSPICTYALSTWLGRPISPILAAEIDRMRRERIYQRQVFFVRNLGFCAPTAARRISLEDSLRFERVHEQTYRAFSCELVEIPAGPLAGRVSTITTTVARLAGLEMSPGGRS